MTWHLVNDPSLTFIRFLYCNFPCISIVIDIALTTTHLKFLSSFLFFRYPSIPLHPFHRVRNHSNCSASYSNTFFPKIPKLPCPSSYNSSCFENIMLVLLTHSFMYTFFSTTCSLGISFTTCFSLSFWFPRVKEE